MKIYANKMQNEVKGDREGLPVSIKLIEMSTVICT